MSRDRDSVVPERVDQRLPVRVILPTNHLISHCSSDRTDQPEECKAREPDDETLFERVLAEVREAVESLFPAPIRRLRSGTLQFDHRPISLRNPGKAIN